jgi:hypothetical protein
MKFRNRQIASTLDTLLRAAQRNSPVQAIISGLNGYQTQRPGPRLRVIIVNAAVTLSIHRQSVGKRGDELTENLKEK